MNRFLGLKQVTKEYYDSIPNNDRLYYIWLVREFSGDTVTNSSIYLGNREYSNLGYTKEEIDIIINNLNTQISGLTYSVESGFTYVDGEITGVTFNLNELSGSVITLKSEVDTKAVIDDDIVSTGKTWSSDKINTHLSTVYKYKGSVATYDDLPQSGNTVGDVYDVVLTSMNYAWDGNAWDPLGSIIDISGKQDKLTPGTGITITSGNTISATEPLFTSSVAHNITSGDTTNWDNKQNKLTKSQIDNINDVTDDAARYNWGGDWRIPTISELNELWSKSWVFTPDASVGTGGRPGYVTISGNGKTLILPTTGKRGNDDSDVFTYSSCESRVLTQDERYREEKSAYAELWRGNYTSYNKFNHITWRCDGIPIRPVIDKGGDTNGHNAIDLGLSVLWADRNVGASEPKMPGNYFAWGEVETKTEFTWDNYKYYDSENSTEENIKLTRYVTDDTYGIVDGLTRLTIASFYTKEESDNRFALKNHTHTKSEITDFPDIPTKTSDLNNDSGFITSGATNLENYYTKSEIDASEETIVDKIAEIDVTLTNKQNKLTAGTGIEISGNTISATGGGGKTYYAGSGITIDSSNYISATDGAMTENEITLSSGAPINALGIWSDNKIPSGTTISEILTKLLCKEMYPDAATKPYLTASGNQSLGAKLIGETVTIDTVTLGTNNGTFKASKYSSPSQPTVSGVSWTDKSISGTKNNGFNGATLTNGETQCTCTTGVTITLGENKITYTLSGKYSRPTNMPKTNIGNDTLSTTKVTTNWDGGDLSAVWEMGTTGKTVYTTATGVYGIYCNFDDNGDIDDNLLNTVKNIGDVKEYDTNKEILESAVSKNMIIDIPKGRNITGLYAYNPFTQKWNSNTYEENTVTHNNVEYYRISTTTGVYSSVRWKITFDTKLSENKQS